MITIITVEAGIYWVKFQAWMTQISQLKLFEKPNFLLIDAVLRKSWMQTSSFHPLRDELFSEALKNF